MILSVGYRVNSKKATQFRQWATNILKKHMIQGYTINRSRIKHNYKSFLQAVDKIEYFMASDSSISNNDILELIKVFSHTWFSLESYDKQLFPKDNFSEKNIQVSANELYEKIQLLKKELVRKKQASELFAQEKIKGNLKGILGNVMQTAFGQDVYPSIEEKAVHLLYFIVKDHPFND